jgi:hypothetical protein
MVSALLPDGKRFDISLPSHYPFTQLLDGASNKGGP